VPTNVGITRIFLSKT